MVCLVTKKMLRKEAADGLVRVIERLNSGSSASDNISSGSDNNTSNNSGRKLNIASLVVNINKEDTNVILGRECVTLLWKTLYRRLHWRYKVPDINRFHFLSG